ncbi:MAG: peptidylprolyl isomerase [Clostridia bacterium]|nr:peptidylprolyl isomerase [Clostridia bacterium]
MKRFVSILLCLILALSLFSCEVGKKAEDTSDEAVSDTGTPSDTTSPIDASEGSKVVMSLGDQEITLAEFNLYYRSIPYQIISQYQYYYGEDYANQLIQEYGFDPNAPYDEQDCSTYDGTWFDYFFEATKSYFTGICAFCNFAEENGGGLTDREKEDCSADVASIVEQATSSGNTLSEYYGDPLGLVTEDVLLSMFYKVSLADKGKELYQNMSDISDEMIAEEYEKNPKDYAVVDYLSYTFQSNGETVKDEEIKSYADELAATTTPEDFAAWVDNYYNNILMADTEEKTDYTVSTLRQKNIKYAEDFEPYAWMFDEAKVGECYESFSENDTICTVYMLASAPHLNDYVKKSVRHIVFNIDNYDGDDAACLAAAENVYKQYLLAPGEDNFASLANQYSDDPEIEYDEDGNATQKEVKTDGGLYANIDPDDNFVTEFKDWAFDTSRKPGDTGIIKTQFGYHIMYFVGDGDPVTAGTDSVRDGLLNGMLLEYIDSFDQTCDKDYLSGVLNQSIAQS